MSQLNFDTIVENDIVQAMLPFYATGTKTTEMLKHSREKLQSIQQNVPLFVNYLALIYSRPTQEVNSTILNCKQFAGIKLQNCLKKTDLTGEQLGHIKYCAIAGLNSVHEMISRTAGSIISALIKKNGLDSWPDLFNILRESANNAPNSKAAFWCMNVLVTDLTSMLMEHHSRPIPSIINICYQFVDSFAENPNVEILNEISEIFKMLVSADKQDLFGTDESTQRFMGALKVMMSIKEPNLDENISVIIDTLIPYPQIIQLQLDNFCGYLLDVVKRGHDQAGLKACCCLLMMFSRENLNDLRAVLFKRNFLTYLVPVVTDAMLLSELAVQTLDAEEEEEDIHPSLLNYTPDLHNAQQGEARYVDHYEGPNDDDDDDDDDEFDLDILENWSLSKCAQQTYQKIVECFPEDTIRLSAVTIDESIRSPNWPVQYRGLLMLGMLSKHANLSITQEVIRNNLDVVMSMLNFNTHPLVTMNACWALSELSEYLRKLDAFPHLMFNLIGLLKHKSHRVQIGASGALYGIGELMNSVLFHNEFFHKLMEAIDYCLKHYQKKTLLHLYDLLDVMVDNIGDKIKTHQFLNMILCQLIEHGKRIRDSSDTVMQYFFIVKKIVKNAGDAITPYAPDIYQRSMKCIWFKIKEYSEYTTNPAKKEPPLAAPLTLSLLCVNEIFAALSYAPNDKLDSIICDRNASFYDALFTCMKHEEGPVRQTVFGIIGDLAKFRVPSFATIDPPVYLEVLIGVLDHIVNRSTDQPTAASNAAWAIGEIALLIRDNINNYMDSILRFLTPIMNSAEALPNLRENCAVTIGRLALVCPKTVSLYSKNFLMNYCLLIIEAKDPTERDQSYEGLLLMFHHHPNQNELNQSLVFIINALAKYNTGAKLNEVNNTLLNIREAFDAQSWNNLIQQFPKDIYNYLSNLKRRHY